MRILIILFVGLFITKISFTQNKMIVDNSFNGYVNYGEFSKPIDSLTDLPLIIQLNLKGFLNQILGDMSNSLTFSHGQIVDLEKKLNEDSTVYRYEWIVPMYDVNFVLKEQSIGINSYYVKVDLDRYGQVVSCNWPRKKYSDKSNFLNLSDLEGFALNQAKKREFFTEKYLVELIYRKETDKLCWIFKFPKSLDKYNQEYNVLNIPWDELKVIDEYIIFIGVSR